MVVKEKYFMCLTDGGNRASRMNTHLLESDKITGVNPPGSHYGSVF
jgi:hypothetical protein